MPVIMSTFKPPACRRLQFDDDEDTEETADQNLANACLEEWRRQGLQESSRRWNFDFERGEPLPGQYEWEPADEETAVAGVTTFEAEQNHQNDLTEAMDCDANTAEADAAGAIAETVDNVDNKHHPLEEEQITTPTKNGGN